MLTRNRKETILTALTLIGQGESVTFNITYFNRKQSEVEAKLNDAGDVPDTILYMVQSWDSEYPLTPEGIMELEGDRPGTIMAVIEGFFAARKVQREKN